jgi:hypothetical protein
VIKLPNTTPSVDMQSVDNSMNSSIMNQPMNEPIDTNDEEGVEKGDEDNNPKKNIQKLAGELSQALRNYNQQQEHPDTDLNKYVMGMVVAQTAKDMTSDEKDEIVNKIKSGEEEISESYDKITEMNNITIKDDEQKKRYDKNAPKHKNPFLANR